MKKILKISLFIIVLLIAGAFLFGYINNEPLPNNKKGADADALANKMLLALNEKAYDTTKTLEWSFRGQHNYKWYKQENKVEVSWKKNKVILHTKSPEQSVVYIDGKQTNNTELTKKANDYFNNDSFWLVAPYKVFDEGVERSIVEHNGKDALLATYKSGGTTPGDSYLWILDENYMPTSFKMWVKIIPIGGLEATWDNWFTAESGCKLPTSHKLPLIGGIEINMGKVKASN